MDERVIKNLVAQLDKLKRRSVRLRYGRVSDLDPLSVKLGDAPAAFTDIRSLTSGLAEDDHVAALVSGNDMIVLDRLGGGTNGGGGGTGATGPAGPPGPGGAPGPAGPAGPTGPSGIVDAEELTLMTGSFHTVDYTLVATDAGKMVRMNSASATVLTVPPQSSVQFPLFTAMGVARGGAGDVTVTNGAGVTIRAPGGLDNLASQYSQGSLWLFSLTGPGGQGEWLLGGDLA